MTNVKQFLTRKQQISEKLKTILKSKKGIYFMIVKDGDSYIKESRFGKNPDAMVEMISHSLDGYAPTAKLRLVEMLLANVMNNNVQTTFGSPTLNQQEMIALEDVLNHVTTIKQQATDRWLENPTTPNNELVNELEKMNLLKGPKPKLKVINGSKK